MHVGQHTRFKAYRMPVLTTVLTRYAACRSSMASNYAQALTGEQLLCILAGSLDACKSSTDPVCWQQCHHHAT
jgi:hypothetical protein